MALSVGSRRPAVSWHPARLRLPTSSISDEVLYAIANLALTAGVDGHRADQVMARGAVAVAAIDGRKEASLADVAKVAPLALAHRMRRTLFDEPRLDSTALGALVTRALGVGETDAGDQQSGGEPGAGQTAMFEIVGASRDDRAGEPGTFAHNLERPIDSTRRSIGGRRHETVSDDSRGRYVRSEKASSDVTASDIALDATIRAAAPHQAARAEGSDLAISIDASELRQKVRTRRVGASIVFCVDASGSMGAANRMSAAKAAVLDLLVDAYQRRDRVSLISFRGDVAEVVLAPTASVELANMKLRNLATGGATPLAAGIAQALDTVESERRRVPDIVPWVVLVTDGRGNVGVNGGVGSEDALTAARRLASARVHTVIVDTGVGPAGGGAARELARVAGGEYVRLSALDGSEMSSAVRRRLEGVR